jgi:glycosyltransferase involved in cell wall biosynthesis
MPYYNPEQFSSAHLFNDLEQSMAELGFSLHVITPTPTRGVSNETRAEYKKRRTELRHGGAVRIARFSLFGEGKNVLLRAVRYLLCNVIEYSKACRIKDADVIFSVSTPPTQGLLAAMVKKRLKIPFVYNLQDVFPDSLVTTGLSKEGSFLWKIGRKIENFTYKHADRIVVVSENMKQNLLNKGVPEHKLSVCYNWVDDSAVTPVSASDNRILDELSLDKSKFYVTYAGNLGESQNIEVMLGAAALLRGRSDISFLIFGSGGNEEKYKAEARQMQLDNVRFFPIQPYNRVSEVYSLGAVSLVSCKKGAGKSALPSKTWSIMSAGTAVLAAFDKDSELDEIITRNNCGICVNPDDPERLAEAVEELYRNSSLCVKMGENGRRFVTEHLGKSAGTGHYIDVFNSLL